MYGHDAELAILVLKQGVCSVSDDILKGNAAQSKIFVEMLTEYINLDVAISSYDPCLPNHEVWDHPII